MQTCLFTNLSIPWTSILSCPHQDIKLSISVCSFTHFLIPWTSILNHFKFYKLRPHKHLHSKDSLLPSTLQHLNISSLSKLAASRHTLALKGHLFSLAHFKVSLLCCIESANLINPQIPNFLQPLQHLKTTSFSSQSTPHDGPKETRSFPYMKLVEQLATQRK